MLRKHFARQLWLNSVLLFGLLFFHIEKQTRWYAPTGTGADGGMVNRLFVSLALVSVVAILAITGMGMVINWLASTLRKSS